VNSGAEEWLEFPASIVAYFAMVQRSFMYSFCSIKSAVPQKNGGNNSHGPLARQHILQLMVIFVKNNPMERNVAKISLSETTKPFERRLDWNVPYKILY
jgi:hypothetical protein